MRADLGKCLSGQPARHPHPLDRLGVLDLGLTDSRGAPPDVLGPGDVRWDVAERGDSAGLEGGRHDLEF